MNDPLWADAASGLGVVAALRRPADSDRAPDAVPLDAVAAFWDATPCGTQNATAAPGTAEFYAQIEAHRYRHEPFIREFARFDQARDRDVLEIGVGAGTDFVQWVRAGARAHGVDISAASLAHVERRLALEGRQAASLRHAPAEALPFPDASFDLVYSWGVLHHGESIAKALAEIARVLRPGGAGRVMLYHRRSLTAVWVWTKWALLRGRPWRSVNDCLARHVESPGTRAVTTAEVAAWLAPLAVSVERIRPVLTAQDRLTHHGALAPAAGAVASVIGPAAGWFLLVEFTRRSGADLTPA